MYYRVIFQFRNHQVAVRVWSYVGKEEAVALARGELVDMDSPLVSCEVHQIQ